MVLANGELPLTTFQSAKLHVCIAGSIDAKVDWTLLLSKLNTVDVEISVEMKFSSLPTMTKIKTPKI